MATTYNEKMKIAKDVYIQVQEKYQEKLDKVFESKFVTVEELYILYMTGSFKISKEVFNGALADVKNPDMKNDIFQSWIKQLEYSGWKSEENEEEIIFSRFR